MIDKCRQKITHIHFILYQIQCVSSNAHPRAELEWDLPQNADWDDSADPQYSYNSVTHTTETIHTIKYKAQLRDDGADLRYIFHTYASHIYYGSVIIIANSC